MCQIFGEKCMFKPRSSKDGTFNLGTPLETKGFTPKARKAMFKLATNISRMVRIARNTSVAVTRTCSRVSAAGNSTLHVECCSQHRGGSRIFFRRGCTRLLLDFNTNKPHSVVFFSQNTSCIRKLQVISGWVRTPCTLP